jgi:hypothetical protein
MVPELGPRDEEFSADFDRVFARWRAALGRRLEPLGIAPDRAAVLADLTISALEGAVIVSPAARSIEPLKTAIEKATAQRAPTESGWTHRGVRPRLPSASSLFRPNPI